MVTKLLIYYYLLSIIRIAFVVIVMEVAMGKMEGYQIKNAKLGIIMMMGVTLAMRKMVGYKAQ